jgi:mRNA interferase MazF
MVRRGDIHWVDFGKPVGHEPALRRPAAVIQSDAYNDSRLGTVIVAVITSNTKLAALPDNVFLPAALTGLDRDSVVNVTALATVDREMVGGRAGVIPVYLMNEVDAGIRAVLAL